MPDLLIELLSEEIPARMQVKAGEDLERLFTAGLEAAGIRAEVVEIYTTPRRLTLIARGLPQQTPAVREERRGPRVDAPPQAVEGFLKSAGLGRDALEERDDKKGRFLYAVLEVPGRPIADLIAESVPEIIREFPWLKSMRWGDKSLEAESLRWVRPIQGIVALLDDEVVGIEFAGLKSGAATVGHRFRHPGIITIGNADDYEAKLRACHVILDRAERVRLIAEGARAAAAAVGLTLVEDQGLFDENAGLTEWPVPLLGKFDRSFLEVPREVIQLTMRTNQKYLACTDASGELAPNFICTANIDAADGGAAIIAGNEKVLAARLADASFFWRQDLKVALSAQAGKLDQILFHEKLGTVAEKVERIALLARWLIEERIVPGGEKITEDEILTLADRAETASRLCKADLVTGMVGEFPELQGIIGGHLARAQGLSDTVADAVRDHYKPIGQEDEVPTTPVTIAVSLADKLDTLCCFFAIGEEPTGSRDPFALRRAAIGESLILQRNSIRLEHRRLWARWCEVSRIAALDGSMDRLVIFLADRLKVQQREAGTRYDLIDAAFALSGEDDLVRLLARVKALQSFVETGEGANLLAGYKRASNILKKEGWVTPAGAAPGAAEDTSAVAADVPGAAGGVGSVPDEQAALSRALDSAERAAAAAIAAEDFGAAMAVLADLRTPIDNFFDKVTVNDVDPAKRQARLALLARVRAAIHGVADFSRIEG